MILLREEQVEQRVEDATTMVGEELNMHKGNYAAPYSRPNPNINSNNFSLETFRSNSIGERFSSEEIQQKLRNAFIVHDLEDVHFEFGLAILDNRGIESYFQRQSEHFIDYYLDTLSDKHHNYGYFLRPQTGTAGENLSVDEVLMVVVPNTKTFVLKSLRWPIASAILFTLVIVTAFYLTVTTMIRQKKLSEIKNDFINNMTHEFKTPIATISLAVDALRNEKVMFDKGKMGYFTGIIKEENLRMNRQVETILKAALMDRQEIQLVLRPVHVHEVIKDVLDNFTLQLQQKNGSVDVKLNAENDLINADEVHFSNLINNLMDNAVKYAKDNVPPEIKISTSSTSKKMIIVIEDNGIGMNRETVKRIFEKFYRAHTGNIHNVKGFGLGLSYVKTMVEAHEGDIKADSVLGRGSIFTIELPLKKVAAVKAVTA